MSCYNVQVSAAESSQRAENQHHQCIQCTVHYHLSIANLTHRSTSEGGSLESLSSNIPTSVYKAYNNKKNNTFNMKSQGDTDRLYSSSAYEKAS